MRDEVLERLRQLNLAPPDPGWVNRALGGWLDRWNALFAGMALAAVGGVIYLLKHQ
jgi:hypothetical protein